MTPLLIFTKEGIYCPKADVYIDPWRKVKKALITHGHSDHARSGHEAYLCHHDSVPILQSRLGKNITVQGVKYGEIITINRVEFSFYPAGHCIGSAQIRVAFNGEVWVATGDYKLEDDGLCTPYEPIKCHTLITECTFGLPIYRWQPQEIIYNQIAHWYEENKAYGNTSLLQAYSLGKAQRLLYGLNGLIAPIYCGATVFKMSQILKENGAALGEFKLLDKKVSTKDLEGALVLAPPNESSTMQILNQTKGFRTGMASGWMAPKSPRFNRQVDRGFVLSDHADWMGLLTAVKASQAAHIIAIHGYTNSFSRHLNDQGIKASTEETLFEGEGKEQAVKGIEP